MTTPAISKTRTRKQQLRFAQPGLATGRIKTDLRFYGFDVKQGDEIVVRAAPVVRVGAVVAVRVVENGKVMFAEFHPRPDGCIILKPCSGERPQLWEARQFIILGTPEIVRRNGEAVWMTDRERKRIWTLAATA